MSSSPETRHDYIAALIADRRSDFSLPRQFFVDPDVYNADLCHVWQTAWLFAGHECELRAPGREIRLRLNDQDVRLTKDGPHGGNKRSAVPAIKGFVV